MSGSAEPALRLVRDEPARRGGAIGSSLRQRQRYAAWMARLARRHGLHDLARSYEIEAEVYLPEHERAANLKRCRA